MSGTGDTPYFGDYPPDFFDFIVIDEPRKRKIALFCNVDTKDVTYGALISRGTQPGQVAVIPGSPADKAGLVENDIILEADGVKIDTDHPITAIVAKKKVGDTVSLKIYHKGDSKNVTVILAEAPAS